MGTKDGGFEKVLPPRDLAEGTTLYDYWVAPSGDGELAFTWQDKPHRLLYDLIGYAKFLEAELEKFNVARS